MKNKTRLISILIFFIAIPGFAQKEHYEIKIIQDSLCLPGAGNIIWLQKKPFRIQVELNDLEGVYLFAAFKDSIYKLSDQQPIPGFKDIPSMSMAEESFNPDQEMIISDDGWAYWFYDPKQDWHRFDKEVVVSGDKVTAFKSVKQFYLPDERTIAVGDVSEVLYLFFVSAKENKKNMLVKELQRYKVMIAWK